jgi:hypothetical protein
MQQDSRRLGNERPNAVDTPACFVRRELTEVVEFSFEMLSKLIEHRLDLRFADFEILEEPLKQNDLVQRQPE